MKWEISKWILSYCTAGVTDTQARTQEEEEEEEKRLLLLRLFGCKRGDDATIHNNLSTPTFSSFSFLSSRRNKRRKKERKKKKWKQKEGKGSFVIRSFVRLVSYSRVRECATRPAHRASCCCCCCCRRPIQTTVYKKIRIFFFPSGKNIKKKLRVTSPKG